MPQGEYAGLTLLNIKNSKEKKLIPLWEFIFWFLFCLVWFIFKVKTVVCLVLPIGEKGKKVKGISVGFQVRPSLPACSELVEAEKRTYFGSFTCSKIGLYFVCLRVTP